MELSGLDFSRAFVPEYMHCVCLGVIRYCLILWISPSEKQKPWYVGDKTAIINRRLSNTKPPYEITRTPRTLDNIKYWKASEFRAFALYYFFLLEDILPKEFFKHFLLLSHGLYYLLQQRIEVVIVKQLKVCFQTFVRDVESLYGIEHVTANVHFSTHSVDSVVDWGALWATSTFIPELLNGQLAALAHGSQHVADQMAKGYLIRNAVCKDAINLLENEDVPAHISKLLTELLCLPLAIRKQTNKGRPIENSRALLLGRPENRYLNVHEDVAVANFFFR